MAVKPVKRTADGKPSVSRRRIRTVPYQGVDPIFIRWQPARVEVANDGGSMDEVGPVEAFRN